MEYLEVLEEPLVRIEEGAGNLPAWAISLILVVGAVLVGYAIHRAVFAFASRLVRDKELFWRSLVQRMRAPMRLAFILGALVVAIGAAPLSNAGDRAVAQVLVVGFIILVAWLARTALHIWTVLHLRRFRLDTEDNLLARKHVTQFRILKRTSEIVIVILAIAAVLMTFEGVRQYGVSLLAAGGAAGVVVGLALQPLLRSIFAGVQLALTQPIRIDDALLVEGEWGNVEEITSTYVVLRLWDWRRLILPLSYFLENPFQNWTREGARLIGTVFIYLDYTVPVPELRATLEKIARGSPLWDGEVAVVQVTDFRETVMEVRALVSARNAGDAFTLRCEVREKLIAWLQDAYPGSLPRLRAEIAERPDRPGPR